MYGAGKVLERQAVLSFRRRLKWRLGQLASLYQAQKKKKKDSLSSRHPACIVSCGLMILLRATYSGHVPYYVWRQEAYHYVHVYTYSTTVRSTTHVRPSVRRGEQLLFDLN